MRIRKIVLTAALGALLGLSAQAQNRYEEDIRVKTTDRGFLVPVTVQGTTYDFLLGLQALPTTMVLEPYAAPMNIVAREQSQEAVSGGYEIAAGGGLEKSRIGEWLFHQSVPVFVIRDARLAEEGVAGILGRDFFFNQVLSIYPAGQTITVSSPYKPSYIQLRHRTELIDGHMLELQAAGQPVCVSIDPCGDYSLTLSAADAQKTGLDAAGGTTTVQLAGNTFDAVSYTVNADAVQSSIGLGMLGRGMLSLDYPRRKAYFEPLETLSRKPEPTDLPEQTDAPVVSESGITHLDRAGFQKLIFDFRAENTWKFNGDKPAVIDFWAEWCGPCKRLNPILDALAQEFGDQVDFYKVDIDQEKEVARHFGISAIPLIWVIPVDGDPVRVTGVRPITELRRIIQEAVK